MKKGTYPISLLVKTSHNFFEDPQNDKKEIENFGASKYQNKRPSKFLEENQMPYLPPLKLHMKKLKIPKNDKKKIEKHTKTKKLSKFTWRKAHTPFAHLWNFTPNFLETPKMTRRKLKIPKLQNTKTKNFQSSQEERQIPPCPPCETSHNFLWRTIKWQEKKLKTPKLQNTKTKNF